MPTSIQEETFEKGIMKGIGFKQFKGFHKVKDITEIYRAESIIGSGKFGQVIKAVHI